MHFLEILAEKLINDYDLNHNQVVVLPNVRAQLFLSRLIQKKAKGAMFMPVFYSSIELMEKLSGMAKADDYQLLTLLFRVYGILDEEGDFETFLSWGQSLLQDLKEIDHQLADTDKLFKALNEIREMEFWNPGNCEPSDFQNKYIHFCSILPQIYNEFTNEMDMTGIGHLGYIERRASESEQVNEFPKNSHFYIAGFNALTSAEEKVFDRLDEEYKAFFFFDYDEYYINDELQEAGHFGRINLDVKRRNTNWPFNNFNNIIKDVRSYSCNTSYEQALLTCTILQGLQDSYDHSDTAIILPEESMLMPVLQHLPEEIADINITMGFGLSNSPYFDFFESFIILFLNRSKPGLLSNNFYFKDLLTFLECDVISRRIETQSLQDFIQAMKIENVVFPEYDAVNELLRSADILLPDQFEVKKFLDFFIKIIQEEDAYLLKEENHSSRVKREFLLHHFEVLEQVRIMSEGLINDMSIQTFHKIWKHYNRLSKVQFTGEPLAGLQIMGLLESRNLDFRNLIFLDMNEGVLPSEKRSGSLIPNDIKRRFNLQLNNEKDAVIAYHFYRAIQRAENVHLLYSNKTGAMGGGEKSRYIIQLENELKYANEEHNVISCIPQVDYKPAQKDSREIVKSEYIQELISKSWKAVFLLQHC